MKKIFAVLGLMFFLSFIISPLYAFETRLVWNLDWEGLNVGIYTPYQAYPNDTMTIRIRVETREDLKNVSVLLKIYGSKSEGYLLWYNPLEILNDIDLSSGVVEDQYFNISIPESVDSGLLHALVSCSWKVWRESSWQERSIDDASIHRMTYLRNKPYEDLQADYSSLQEIYGDLEGSLNDLQANYSALLMSYEELLANYNSLQSSFNSLQTNCDSLNSTYQSLLSDYSSLQDHHNELKSKYEFAGETANTRNLMYVFIETTVIFITTTIYFARVRIYSALGKQEPKEIQPS